MEIKFPDTRENTIITQKVEFFIRIFVLAAGLFLLSRNLDSQFVGWHEDNNCFFSYFARNHIRYGLGYTKMFCTWGDTMLPPAEPHRYLNHPPLLSVWAAIPMLIFGDHEWVARSVPIAMTLGGAWILMVIVSRLQSPLFGVLTGLFYVTFPITAYFGRMLCHESPAQFFSLLMLHGYLQWSGLYGESYSRKAGAAYYLAAVTLGIGTGWAAVIMAGLIWLWHVCRFFGRGLQSRLFLWLTLTPSISLIAVLTHIAWGSDWRIDWLGSLFLSRTAGPEGSVSWAEWFSRNWLWLKFNFTVLPVIAGIICLISVPVILYYVKKNAVFRGIALNRASIAPILLLALQGLIWVFMFKRQSGIHDYWQYFIAPFFAAAMGALVIGTYTLFYKYNASIAFWAAFFLVVLPMPLFAGGIDGNYEYEPEPHTDLRGMVSTFARLAQLLGPGIPAMTSIDYRESELFGHYAYRWTSPQAAYYAKRPLIYTIDINEIEANRQNCAAYILRATNDPNMYQLAQKLGEKGRLAAVERGYMIFLLNPRPQTNEQMLSK